MAVYEKDKMIVEGKTKKLWTVKGNDTVFLVESKEDITAFDDSSYTKKFGTKAKSATHTTCRVFELLRDAGISVSYVEQISDTEFIVKKNQMIPLEVIIRRYIGPGSSYLKRMPQLGEDLPLRFSNLIFEVFLKTTGNQLKIGENILVDGLAVEDPLIVNPAADVSEWKLFHPKKPAWDPEADLKKSVSVADFIWNIGYQNTAAELIAEIERATRRIFLVLEGAWMTLGYRMLDFKIEFAIDEATGKIMVADVIDNDSWRLRTADWREVSKQVFRDHGLTDEVEEAYTLVAQEVGKFRIPKQALVVWRGSKNDPIPVIPELAGVTMVDIVDSGHKGTKRSLSRVNELYKKFPEGGVLLALVGRSNGLGPIDAAHTSWPVVSVPVTYKEFPEDVWSSLRMPSQVPMATILPDNEKMGNAVDFALNILAQKNPAVYAYRQYGIELLDI